MKKWNGKKRIGRKARAMRAGLRSLPPGLYTFQIHAVEMLDQRSMKLVFNSPSFGKTSLRMSL